MALGLCCEWVTLEKGKLKNHLVSRTLQLGKFQKQQYTEAQIRQCYIDNLANLLQILPIVNRSGIKFFRVSSSIFPLFDKVAKQYYDNSDVHALLKQIGKYSQEQGIRLVTHPGQFVVLSSDDPNVVDNSLREMNFHGWMFDCMGLARTPYYAINIHGGKAARSLPLIKAIARLDDSARLRMTLENDEFSYSVSKLKPISEVTGVPIVFDSHHHSLNSDNLSGAEAQKIAIATWPKGIKPTTHLSNSKEEHQDSTISKKRIHSDYIRYIPDHQKEAHQQGLIDIEIEAKAKNLAVLEMAKKFELTLA